MTQEHNQKTAGFTLVELSLSMAFLSMLLLAIALLTLNISGIYNKGLTVKSVNEAGQLVSTDVQRTLNASKPIAVFYATDGNATTATGGRLCADLDVYAWNYGKALKNGTPNNPNANAMNKFATVQDKAIRFVKFPAKSTEYCKMLSGAYPSIPADAAEILTRGDVDLAVHDFEINSTTNADGSKTAGQAVVDDPTQRMYQIAITIGTSEQGILLDNSQGNANGCKTPTSVVDDQYCAVNQFEFTSRAGNR